MLFRSELEAAIESVINALEDSLDESEKQQIRQTIITQVKSTSPYYKDMVDKFMELWYHMLAGNEHTIIMPEVAKCMVAKTSNHAQILSQIWALNINVHRERYYKVISSILSQFPPPDPNSRPAKKSKN